MKFRPRWNFLIYCKFVINPRSTGPADQAKLTKSFYGSTYSWYELGKREVSNYSCLLPFFPNSYQEYILFETKSIRQYMPLAFSQDFVSKRMCTKLFWTFFPYTSLTYNRISEIAFEKLFSCKSFKVFIKVENSARCHGKKAKFNPWAACRNGSKWWGTFVYKHSFQKKLIL